MPPSNVQIFGLKSSRATRAAERFFKERRIPIQFVDLQLRGMAPAEIKRFIDRFGLTELLDRGSKAYLDAGLSYMRLANDELIDKIERNPALLSLPLVRAGNRLSIGQDERSWKEMIGSH